MPLFDLSGRRRREDTAHALYAAVVAQARLPDFYLRHGVPDSVDGRFDLVALHAFLALRRLGGTDEKALSQALLDLMFADMDQNLREMGVGDLSVGRKVRVMAEAFFGRVAAYDKAFAEGEAGLAEAVLRNLFRGDGERRDAARAVAVYMLRQDAHLAALTDAALTEGRLSFLAPEG